VTPPGTAQPGEAPGKFETRVLPDLAGIAEAAAREFAEAAAEATKERGVFRVALSGGGTPRPFHERLTRKPFRREIHWEKTLFFWGDERCVPPNHERSNYRMAKETLLDPLKIPAGNVFRMRGEEEPRRTATAYEKVLRERFGAGGLPRLDFALMGIGEDGHTASLFPGTPALAEKKKWVAATRSPERESRLTLTYPVFNAARRVVFLVSGKEKSGPVAKILKKEPGYSQFPASGIRPKRGSLLWLLDEEAGADL